MGVDKNEENRKVIEIDTPEPPQRMYPLEPFEKQPLPNKKHGMPNEEKVKAKE